MRESRIPVSRFGRLWQYGGLATSMAFGAVGESFRRVTGTGSGDGSLMLSEANMNRLVAKLSRMRGAALKLGQMMSFQGMSCYIFTFCRSARLGWIWICRVILFALSSPVTYDQRLPENYGSRPLSDIQAANRAISTVVGDHTGIPPVVCFCFLASRRVRSRFDIFGCFGRSGVNLLGRGFRCTELLTF